MQANWSLVLNAILLVGVIVAIGYVLKIKRKTLVSNSHPPSVGQPANPPDDVISVRKIHLESATDQSVIRPNLHAAKSPLGQAAVHEVTLLEERAKPTVGARPVVTMTRVSEPQEPALEPKRVVQDQDETPVLSDSEPASSLVMFLLAKEQRQLAGYELLQTILGAGLRFGEGQLFHRHQSTNGQGPVLCSLAAATKTGVFDMQNIGSFSVRGLCLFMQTSGNSTIDKERFDIMLDTAKKLSEDLDTYLLDDRRETLSEKSIHRYELSIGQEMALEFE